MDNLDIRIFRQMVQGPIEFPLQPDSRVSLRLVAAKVGADEVTVRNRVKRFYDTGFLSGWKIIVNPNLLGLTMAQLWLTIRSDSSKEEAVRKLKLVEGVFVIVEHFGDSLTIVLLYRNEQALKRKMDLIASISGDENPIFARIPFPECKIKLGLTDWKIIGCLQEAPQSSISQIAAELRVSSRTVRRKLARMKDERVLFSVPRTNPKALKGAIITDLLIFYASLNCKAKIDEKVTSNLSECLVRAELGDREHAFLNLIINNVTKAQEILNWLKKEPCVKASQIWLVQSFEVMDTFSEYVRERITPVLV